MLLNYLSIVFLGSEALIYIVRAIMLAAVFQIALFYVFAGQFPYGEVKSLKTEPLQAYGLFTLITAAVALSPHMFRSISVENGVIQTRIGTGIPVFVLFTCISIVMAFKILIRKFFLAAGTQRRQIFLLLLAATLNWIVVPITNFVLTLAFKNLFFVTFSPVFGLLFASILGYALIRHRLFDMHTVLRDSIIYMDYYLRKRRYGAERYYELQSLVYHSSSNHIALDFSGVQDIDQETVKLLKTLRTYMGEQGRKVYFVGYTDKVFRSLRPAMPSL
jgi:hypothetical protein